MDKSLVSLLLLVAVGCGEAGTHVRLTVSYAEAPEIDTLNVSGRDSTGNLVGDDEVAATEVVRIRVPDTRGVVTIQVQGSSGGVRRAFGQVSVTTTVGQEVPATVVLRPAQGEWCVPGELACDSRSNTVVRCVLSDDGRLRNDLEETCDAATQSCSLGECRPLAECLNECTLGPPECAGPFNTRMCATDVDADDCTDYGMAIPCPDGQTCNAGVCSEVCVDQCAPGETRCSDLAEQVCEDRDGDGCREWSPRVACRGAQQQCDSSELTTSRPVCDMGQCAVMTTTTECDCVDGACRSCVPSRDCTNPGPCEVSEGATCGSDGCLYALRDVGESCDDGRECTASSTCSASGVCEGAVSCDVPPPTCLSPTMQVTYIAGRCTAAGECAFTQAETPCSVCSEGRCWTETTITPLAGTPEMAVLNGEAHVGFRGLTVGDILYASPPATDPPRSMITGRPRFRLIVSPGGRAQLFSQASDGVVRHRAQQADGSWASSLSLDPAENFVVAASSTGELHLVGSRSDGGNLFHQRCESPCEAWGASVDVTTSAAEPLALAVEGDVPVVLYAINNQVQISRRLGSWSVKGFTPTVGAVEAGALSFDGRFATFLFVADGSVNRAAIDVGLLGSTEVALELIAESEENTAIALATSGDGFVGAWVETAGANSLVRIARLDPLETMSMFSSALDPGLRDGPRFVLEPSGRAHLLYRSDTGELIYATTPSL